MSAIPLSVVSIEGERALRVAQMDPGPETTRLMSMGICVGSTVDVSRAGCHFVLRAGVSRVAIGREVAEQISVSEVIEQREG